MDSEPKHQLADAVHVDYAVKLDGSLERDKVMSAELANALTIDRISPWSRSGLKLCWLVTVTGISKLFCPLFFQRIS
jgi:hypothetical protein